MKNLILKFNLITFLLLAVLFTSCEKDEIIIDTPIYEPIDDLLDNPPTEADYIVKLAIPAEDYQSVFNSITARNYRLAFIDGFVHRAGVATDTYNKVMFNAVFVENVDNLKWASFHGLSGGQYQDKFDEYIGNGYRLMHIESYPSNGKIKYAPIFVKQNGPAFKAVHGKKLSDWQDYFDQRIAEGYRLVNRSIVWKGDKRYVAALFDKKNVGSWMSKSGQTPAETQTLMEDNKDLGRAATFLDVCQKTSTDFTFGPIFNSEPHQNWYALNKLSKEDLLDELTAAKNNDYKVTFVVAYDEPALLNGNEYYEMRFAVGFRK